MARVGSWAVLRADGLSESRSETGPYGFDFAAVANLFYRVAVGVDFVDFADVEFADAGFDFAHVTDDDPDEMIGENIFLGDLVGVGGSDGQRFGGEGVVIIGRQAVLENLAVGAGELLDGFERAGEIEGGAGLFVF